MLQLVSCVYIYIYIAYLRRSFLWRDFPKTAYCTTSDFSLICIDPLVTFYSKLSAIYFPIPENVQFPLQHCFNIIIKRFICYLICDLPNSIQVLSCLNTKHGEMSVKLTQHTASWCFKEIGVIIKMPLQGGIVAQRQSFELKVLEITGQLWWEKRWVLFFRWTTETKRKLWTLMYPY